jgi:hypothetical protein
VTYPSKELHKNDPGTYIITYYDTVGRKTESTLTTGYLTALVEIDEWVTGGHGTAVIHRCLYNSALARPAMPLSAQT